MTPTENLKRLGWTLPNLSPPAGSYVHATRSGSLLSLAGKGAGKYTGKVGKDVSLEQAREYACSKDFWIYKFCTGFFKPSKSYGCMFKPSKRNIW